MLRILCVPVVKGGPHYIEPLRSLRSFVLSALLLEYCWNAEIAEVSQSAQRFYGFGLVGFRERGDASHPLRSLYE